MTLPDPDGMSRQAVVVVRIGGSRWAIPVSQVVEVLRDAAIARIPGTGAAVRGMANHRGRALVVADPGRALELQEESVQSVEVVVLQVNGLRFGIVVDAVVELLPEARTTLATLPVERIAIAVFPLSP